MSNFEIIAAVANEQLNKSIDQVRELTYKLHDKKMSFQNLQSISRGVKESDENEKEELRNDIEYLLVQLKQHKHTDECLAYAAKTGKDSGCYDCIMQCANSLREVFKKYPEDD